MPATLSDEQAEWVRALVGLYQDQLRYAAEIVPVSELFFREDVQLDDEAKAMLAEEHAPIVLGSFQKQVEGASDFSVDTIKALVKAVQTETGYKGKPLFMTIRVALTGQMHGPDLNMTIRLLGRDTVLARLKKLL